MSDRSIKEQVRENYARAARRVSGQDGGCCGTAPVAIQSARICMPKAKDRRCRPRRLPRRSDAAIRTIQATVQRCLNGWLG